MQQLNGFVLIVVGFFLSLLALLEIGRRVGTWRRLKDVQGADAGLGVVDGAIFGLMGLMIAFAFSGAGARFDARRQLMGQEANAIGTAYLRLDLLPAAAQANLRQYFKDYADARIGFYRSIGVDSNTALEHQARSSALQGQIWAGALEGCKEVRDPATTSLVLSSLNQMIDITTTQAVALETHPPQAIYWGLLVLLLSSALLAGYGMAKSKKRSWIHMIIYSAVMSAAIYVTLDYEYPRLGLIRVDTADQVLIDARKAMD